MGPPSAGDRAQEDAFCDELHRRIARLDHKSERFKAELAKHTAARRTAQIARFQTKLRDTAVERRKLIDMLIAIGHSFPCRHTGSDGPRQPHEE